MAGVYIPSMEMPENCMACQWSRTDIANTDWCVLTKKDLPCDCPLVAVPNHGRLIDADAFAIEMIDRQMNAEEWLRIAKDHDTAVRADAVLSFLCEVKLTLDKMPTVIPADKEKQT